jgi:hypothetical protein
MQAVTEVIVTFAKGRHLFYRAEMGCNERLRRKPTV